jgi:4-hydroxybenzoate polyprenyltransferase
MIALVQVLIKYALFEPFLKNTNLSVTLNGFGFSLLVLSTVCLAAAGYIINDIYDIETDTINKPEKVIVGKAISENRSFNLFVALNLIGVGIGFYLSFMVESRFFFILFILISALLYLYATHLKEITLIGNIVVSLVVGFSILIVGLFDLIPVITEANQQTQLTFFDIVKDYAIFAFIINLLREIAKDIEDVDGDYKAGRKTLAVVFGRNRAKNILLISMMISIILIISYLLKNLYTQEIAVGYFLLFIIGPLIFLSIKTYGAKRKADFSLISRVLKIVMVLGMFSLVIYQYILLK